MKNWLKWGFLVLLLLVLVAGVLTLSQEEPIVPDKPTPTHPPETTREPTIQYAPDFTVVDAQGNPVKLSDFKGKPVVLNFWATWCGYCKQEMPVFEAAAQKHPDIQFMMINATDGEQETMAGAMAYIAQSGYTFDVFYDTNLEAVNTYGISAFPTTFFIDKDGVLVAYVSGALEEETLSKGLAMID